MGDSAGDEGRIGFLDALRGVAILGILPVNAPCFAFPVLLGEFPDYPEGGGAASALAVRAVRILFKEKFVTIFALLFGAGMAILRARARERGHGWWPIVLRRLGALWVVGCLHAVLVWWGDILSYYAMFGLAVCWAPGRSRRFLVIAGGALLALPLAGLGVAAATGGEAGWATEYAPSESPALPDGLHGSWAPGSWDGFADQVAAFDPDFEIAVYRGGTFAQMTALRSATWGGGVVGAIPYWGPRLLGLMLLGMASAGEGWFLAPGSEEGRRRFRALLLGGLLVGVPCTAASAILGGGGPETPAVALGAEAAQYTGSLGLAAAYIAIVAMACARFPGAAVVRGLSAAGRMAFTNYLLQSATMTMIFCGATVFLGAGLGLFGSVGRLPLLALVALLAGFQVAASLLWFRAFRMGPAEWAWRAVTYWRLPRMRK